MAETLYSFLEVDSQASPKALKLQFLRKARLCHPDRVAAGSEEVKHEAGEHFNLIKDAYEVLCDEELRRIYDKHINQGHEFAYREIDMIRQARVYFQHMKNLESSEPTSAISSPDGVKVPKKRGRPPGSTSAKISRRNSEAIPTEPSTASNETAVDDGSCNTWSQFPLNQRREFFNFALDHYIPRDCPHRVQYLAPGDFREVAQAAFDAYCLRFFRGILNPREVPAEDRSSYLTEQAQETFKHRYGTLVLLDVALQDARKIGALQFHRKLCAAARTEPPSFSTEHGWVFGPEEEVRLLELTAPRFGISDCVNRAAGDDFLWPKACQSRRVAFKNFLEARLRWMITALVAISSGSQVSQV